MINTLNGKTKAIIIFLFFMVVSIGLSLSPLRSNEQCAYADNTYTNLPVITVITHGLGGSPVDWSNDGEHFNDPNGGLNTADVLTANAKYTGNNYRDYNFKHSDDSLIEKLRKKNNNSLVYIVSVNNNASVNNGNPYIDKFTPDSSSPTGYSAEVVTTMDFSKHSIIIYNAESTGKTFAVYDGNGYGINNLDFTADSVVEDFYTTINYIVEMYQTVNNNVLPKMNLIGHSQGTIVNLLYATKYPDMIDSMFALGGLFNGSTLLRAIYVAGNGTIEQKAAAIQSAFEAQPGYNPNSMAADIINTITCSFGQDMANSAYTTALKNNWNSAVLGKTIKGYAVGSYFDIEFLKAQIGVQSSLTSVQKAAINLSISGIQNAYRLGVSGGNIFVAVLMDIMTDVYGLTEFSTEQENSLAVALSAIFDGAMGNPVVHMDGFLELYTQEANSYSNFERTYRKYGYNTDFTHKAQNSIEIVHNLETQDMRTINYICSNIEMGSFSLFEYEMVSYNTITITRINRDTTVMPQSLTIPSLIDSKTVVRIGGQAFCDNFYGCSSITGVIIPSTITEIGFGAFQNCTNLTSVTFAPNSQLTTIYAYAFAGCTNLTSIDLPNTVTTIHEYAFADTGLTSCNLKNVSSLGYGVFADCHSLTSFSKNSGNSSLTIGDSKVVYGSSSTQLLAYACGNTGTSFTIPNTVTIIGESAFKGADHLTLVTFPTSLAEVRFSAFENCTGLTSVELPGTVTDIGAFAFSGCYNLSSVRMFSTGNIAIGMGAFTGTDSVSFTVPQARISYYQSTEGLAPYASSVTAITYQILYTTYNGQTISPTTVYYGVIPTIFNKNDLNPRTGYAIDGWYLSTTGSNGTGTAFIFSTNFTP